jgi:hypothetical protein
MLAQLRRNAGRDSARIATHCVDARTWIPAPVRYDLIVTHFFLDCLTTADVATLASRLRPLVAPEGHWLISEFAVPQGWFGRLVAQSLVSLLYAAFRLLTSLEVRQLPAYRKALSDAGFTLVHEKKSLCGLLTSEVWTPAQETCT